MKKHIKTVHDGHKNISANHVKNDGYKKTILTDTSELFPKPTKIESQAHEQILGQNPNLKSLTEAVANGEKKYQCHVCEQLFSLRAGLKTHVESVHEDQERQLACEETGFNR